MSALALLLSAPLVFGAQPCQQPVATTRGLVRGIQDGETCAWRGIPYARPPTGDLRWRAPEPPVTWTGVRDGSAWGPRCVQPNTPIFRWMNRDPSKQMSEDCLYLNVWRPRGDGPFPVMVWIHGGGYGLGTANTPTYWGDRLAVDGDVVVVSIGYRIGYLGFLALPALADEDPHGSSGSYGTLDQLAALGWVRDNIAAFGGDPGSVTVFGESAGGWSVCSLIATPLSQGLFQRAIMQSGGCERVASLDDGYTQGAAAADAWGCSPDDLVCLRALSAEDIGKASPPPTFAAFTYGPHLDGYVHAELPLEQIRGSEHVPVALLAGFTRDEVAMSVHTEHRPLERVRPDEYEDGIALLTGDVERAGEVAALYPLEAYGGAPLGAFRQMVADFALICPTWRGLHAAAIAQPGLPTWLYRFDYDEHRFGKRWGANHGLDVPFTFESTDRPPFSGLFRRRDREPAQQLSRVMAAYWLAFARLGDPNGDGRPDWPAYDPDDPRMLRLDQEIEAAAVQIAPQCTYWEAHPLDLDW